jgi:predicted ATPase/DNA-binding CsgD family transcriptional regulator
MSSLPAPLTRFVGREAELAQVEDLLHNNRLLTLTGPGGAGKTRLAIRLASATADDFPDGAWFVDLAPLTGGQFVWDQMAIVLGVREPGRGRALSEAVGGRLASRQALLVLDNCEHVVGSVAEVTGDVLAAAPAVKVIATSREPLGVAGEVTWAVPPLTETDATELFVDRARRALPRFRLDDDDRQAVRFICERLDGLPLAIELAAARTRMLDPEQIAAGLKDRFLTLPSGPRTAPKRQATLEASFDWSYDLLSDAERALLRQLSVFAGGFDLEAALAVCPAASIDLLAALTDRSLIIIERGSDHAAPRYRMLETVRQFAAQHLDEADEEGLMRGRHRDHYLALAETAEHLLGPDEDSWRARLDREQDNLRTALTWSRDQGDAQLLARMVAALYWFWAIPGRFGEFRTWLEAAAERAGELTPAFRARMRNYECLLAVLTGRMAEVPVLGNEALALAREAGDQREEALALLYLAGLAGLIGGAEAMRPYFEEGLLLARSTGFALAAVQGLELFVALRWFQSDPVETRRLAEEVIEISKSMDRHHRLDGILWAAMTALFQGRLPEASQLFEKAVAEGRDTNDLNYLFGQLGLALVTTFRGDLASAHERLGEGRLASQSWEIEARFALGFEGISAFVQGWMQLTSGEAARAIDNLMPAVEALRSSPLANWAAVPLVLVAEAQLATGAVEAAAAALDEATSLSRRGAMTWSLGRASRIRAILLARQGNFNDAESAAHVALRLAREAGDELGLVDSLELLATLAAQQDSHREAVRLWAAADSMRDRLGYRLVIDGPAQKAAIADAREKVTDFSAVWAEGARLSVEEAIAYAARGRGERKRPATGWASLTPSELEVARLVGKHLSNPEIASRLFVSRATVKTHLVHIFTKLGIDSRSALAAEALKRG